MIYSLQQLLIVSVTTIDRLIVVIVSLALIFFLWGLATFILHSGSEEKRLEGKQKMLWGIIALAVMLGIWGIVKIMQIALFGTIFPNPPEFF